MVPLVPGGMAVLNNLQLAFNLKEKKGKEKKGKEKKRKRNWEEGVWRLFR